MSRRTLLPLLLLCGLALFMTGTYHGRWTVRRHQPTFHDMIVTHTFDYSTLINPRDPAVRSRAARFASLPEAYAFVRDAIVFDPSAQTSTPSETLRDGRASCLGKAALLCSLYRAMGTPPDRVHVVVGEIVTPRMTSEHAWLEIDTPSHGYLQQDSTGLIATFPFDAFPDNSYTDAFVRKESFCFNDHGFAVVSQRNRLRDQMHPGNATGTLPAP